MHVLLIAQSHLKKVSLKEHTDVPAHTHTHTHTHTSKLLIPSNIIGCLCLNSEELVSRNS